VFHNTTPDVQDEDRYFWSQTGIVLRPTVSDHITDGHLGEFVKKIQLAFHG